MINSNSLMKSLFDIKSKRVFIIMSIISTDNIFLGGEKEMSFEGLKGLFEKKVIDSSS